MNNFSKTMAVAAALVAACAATHAATVTSGFLTRADGSDTIADTLNNRTWLGADVTKGLDFTQTLAALGMGGRFDGYRMAYYEDAMKYVNAITGGSATCDSYNNGYDVATCQGDGTAGTKQVFGESYVDYRSTYSNYYGDGTDYDYMFFLSEAGQGDGLSQSVGLVQLYSNYEISNIYATKRWADVYNANNYASGSESIGWLLFRDGTSDIEVPEPGSLSLAALAVAGVAVTRRRRAVVGG